MRYSSANSDFAGRARQRWGVDVLLARTEVTIDADGAHVHVHLIVIPRRFLPPHIAGRPLASLRRSLGGAEVKDGGRVRDQEVVGVRQQEALASVLAARLVGYLVKADDLLGLSDDDLRTFAHQLEGVAVLRAMGTLRLWRARARELGIRFRAAGHLLVAVLPESSGKPQVGPRPTGEVPPEAEHKPRDRLFTKIRYRYRHNPDTRHAEPCLVLSGPGRHAPGPRAREWIAKGDLWIASERAKLAAGKIPYGASDLLRQEREACFLGTGTPAQPGSPPHYYVPLYARRLRQERPRPPRAGTGSPEDGSPHLRVADDPLSEATDREPASDDDAA